MNSELQRNMLVLDQIKRTDQSTSVRSGLTMNQDGIRPLFKNVKKRLQAIRGRQIVIGYFDILVFHSDAPANSHFGLIPRAIGRIPAKINNGLNMVDDDFVLKTNAEPGCHGRSE